MDKRIHKILSMILVILMFLGNIPVAVFASEDTPVILDETSSGEQTGSDTGLVEDSSVTEQPSDEEDIPVADGQFTVTLYTTADGLTLSDKDGEAVAITESTSGDYKTYAFTAPAGTYSYETEDYGKGVIKVTKSEDIYLRVVNYKLQEEAPAAFTVKVVSSKDEELVYNSTSDKQIVKLLIPAYGYAHRYRFNFIPAEERYASFSGNLWVTKGTGEFEGFKTSSYNLSDGNTYKMSSKFKVTFQIPEGANLKVQQLVKFYRQLNEFETTFIKNENGYDYYEAYAANEGGSMQYEVSLDGYDFKIVNGFSSQNPSIVVEKSEFEEERTPSSYENGLITNGNASKFIELEVGDSFDIWFSRAWQAVDNITSNQYIDPDRHFYVLSGDSVDVDKFGVVTAVKEGVTVVAMTYDAMVSDNELYGAVDPDKVAVFVFSVGGTKDGLDIGINLSDLQTFYIGKTITVDGTDTVIKNDSYKYTFNPTTTTDDEIKVSVATVKGYPTPTMSQWKNYTKNSDGTFTIDLYSGRNIVKVTAGDAESYYVINAIESDVTITNVTNPGNAIAAGDSVKIAYTGVITPQPKLGAIYNPGFGGTVYLEGTLSNTTEGVEDATIQGGTTQYGISAMSNIVFVPNNAGNVTVKDVRIHLGSFGSAPSAHWKLGLQSGGGSYDGGMAPESTAYYCFFPDVTFEVLDSANIEKAAAIVELINAIGEVTFTDEAKARIDDARNAYEMANETVQSMITSDQFKVLTDAENAYQKLLDSSITDSIKTTTIDGKEYYEITNADELVWFSRLVNGLVEGHPLTSNQTKRESVNAILKNDITLNEDVLDENYNLKARSTALRKWMPLGGRTVRQGWSGMNTYFRGIFDGNGHTISGMYIGSYNECGSYIGFVGLANGAVLKNISFEDCYLDGTGFTNSLYGFAGAAGGSGTQLTGVTFDGKIVAGSFNAAGLVATNNKPLEDCHFTGVIETAGTGVGGLAYTNSNTVKNCTVDVKILVNRTGNGNSSAGALVGSNSGTIENCIAEGTVTTNFKTAGGFAGTNSGTLKNNISFVTVTAPEIAAGISAAGTGTIDSCFAYGMLSNGEAIVVNTETEGACYGIAPSFKYNTPSVFFNTMADTEVDGAVSMTAEQIENGNAAYVLGTGFGQMVGKDIMPVFADGKNQVYYAGGEYVNASAANLDKLVGEIGEVGLDGAENCFARTTEAKQMYDMLTDEEKAKITDLDGFNAKQKAYEDTVTALIAKIEAIRPVNSSDESFARIDAAKADFDKFVAHAGDETLITNRTFIEEAYADHALWVRHDAEYAIEKTIEKTTIADKEYYVLTNADQLTWFSWLVNGVLAKTPQNIEANAVLANDIVLNEDLMDTIVEDGAIISEIPETVKVWEHPIGVSYTGFKGIFDGQGYSVKGIYVVNETGSNFYGLFGDVNGTVKNLTVEDSVFANYSNGSMGPVAGRISTNGLAEKCEVINTLVYSKGANAGGLVGSVDGYGIVRNSYSVADITGTADKLRVGGIAGNVGNSTVENCYYAGKCTIKGYGGIVPSFGAYSKDIVTNCYWPADTDFMAESGSMGKVVLTGGGSFTNDDLTGGKLAYNLGEEFGQKIGTDTHPVFRNSENTVYLAGESYGNASAEIAIAIIGTIGTVSLENGTEDCIGRTQDARECYDNLSDEEKALVTNYEVLQAAEEDLKVIVKTIEDEIATFSPLTLENIEVYKASDIADIVYEYTSLGGDMEKIANNADYQTALDTANALILTAAEEAIQTTEIDGKEYYVIGDEYELMWFTNLVNGTLPTDTPKNEYANAILSDDITINKNLLGTIGEGVTAVPENVLRKIKTQTVIGNYYYYGTFDGDGHTISGMYIPQYGLFRALYGTVRNLNIVDSFVGGEDKNGVAGFVSESQAGSVIENCSFEGRVVGKQTVAGIVGQALGSTTIKNCYVNADIYSFISGGMSYPANDGGIVGSLYNNSVIENCYTEGTISCQKDNGGGYGGIAGQANGSTIRNCYSAMTFDVKVPRSLGGILGGGYYGPEASNGSTLENNFYLENGVFKACGYTDSYKDYEGIAETRTAEEFADGTIAGLLGLPFTQRSADKMPVLAQAAVEIVFEKDEFADGEEFTAKVYLIDIGKTDDFDTVGYSISYNKDAVVAMKAQVAENLKENAKGCMIDANSGVIKRVLFVGVEDDRSLEFKDGKVLIDTITFKALADGKVDAQFTTVEGDIDFEEVKVTAYDTGAELITGALITYERIVAEDKIAADVIEEIIAQIGETVEYTDFAIAKEAREGYDALEEAVKQYVENYDVLLAAETVQAFWKEGDVNVNGKINAQDLSMILGNYGQTELTEKNICCDIAGDDGKINAGDLSVVLTNYSRRIVK